MILEINDLCKTFRTAASLEPIEVLKNLNLEMETGETLAILGQSGSGKSTLGRSILRLAPVTAGSVNFDGTTLTDLEGRELKQFRRRMQMIFQDPFASLNPRMTVYDTLAEPLLLHNICSRAELDGCIARLMDDVGLARSFIRKYPHEFSGGQRQRIAIGRAIATRPEFIVADEPVSALDVTIQAQVLELLMELGREHQLTMLFVSHDMAVIRQIAHRVLVMYRGQIVEQGDVRQVFTEPRETYTQTLLASTPGAATSV